MATSVKMSSKHQIVIPREARAALHLRPGARLLVSVRPDRVIEIRCAPRDISEELEGLISSPEGALWPELNNE